MAIGDLYRVTIECHYSATGTQVNNVLHFVEQVDHGDTGARDLGQDWNDNFSTFVGPWQAYIQNQFSFDRLRVQRLFPTLDAPVVTPFTPARVGSSAFAPAPSIAAMVVRLHGLRVGRTGLGRLYLGGFAWDASEQDDGHWYVNTVTFVGNGWNAHRVHYTGGSADWLWVVYSSKLGGRRPYSSLGATPVQSIAVDNVVRLQRSREYGVSRRHAGRH